MFNNPKINKPKGYNKLMTSFFVDMQLLTKCLRATLMLNKDIYESIAIIIAPNSIHINFDTKLSNFLETGNKTINKIS